MQVELLRKANILFLSMLVFSIPIEETEIDNLLKNIHKSSSYIFTVWKNEHALYFGGRALYFCSTHW